MTKLELNKQDNLTPQLNRHPNKADSINVNKMAKLARIEQLECELQQKDRALARSQKEQMLLREQLNASIQSIHDTSKQITNAGNDLKNKYRQILDYVEELRQEIKALECSNEVWSNRSITLQFDVLTAQNEAKATHADHDLAIKTIALLEIELKQIKAENKSLRTQINKTN